MTATRLTLAIAARNTDDACRLMDIYKTKIDMAEIRLDLMEKYNLKQLLNNRPCPVIITNRAIWEGGQSRKTDEERLADLEEAAALGAEHIDFELKAASCVQRERIHAALLILSSHDFSQMPDLLSCCSHARHAGADIAKAVGMAQTVRDTLIALHTLKTISKPSIVLAMGEAGMLTRILAPRYNAYLTFASPASRAGTAPGQVTVESLHEVYLFKYINQQTQVYGYFVPSGAIPEQELQTANHRLREAGKNAVIVPLPVNPSENSVQVSALFQQQGFIDFAWASPLRTGKEPLLDSALSKWIE